MVAKLATTKDYGRFELCQFNRSVSKKKNLLASMKEHGYIPAYPIHCSKGIGNRLTIKAGHHRFECAQELGIAVYYVISEDSATIHELEKATNQWRMHDYLESYVRCGLQAYQRIKEYHLETGISLNACVSILGGESAQSGNLIKRFKDGLIEIRGEKHAAEIRDLILYCHRLDIATDTIFTKAISRCLFVPEFSADVFKARVLSNTAMVKKCRTLVEQMQQLEDIYNFKATAKNRLPLCFLADQAMKNRCPVGRKQ